MSSASREGSLEAPTRHPLGQNEPGFYDEAALMEELERVYDICHGCRRCVSLCNAFPTLFDLVDESDTLEVDGVDKADFWQVVDHCYLCDLCYLTKCPYVPPHEWNVDFPHLMLRAKAIGYKQGRAKFRDKVITSTDTVGSFASIPIVANVVNAANKNEHTRALLESALDVHPDARLPEYHSDTLSKRCRNHKPGEHEVRSSDKTTGKVAIFATCYGEYNEPQVAQDLLAVFEHNQIPTMIVKNTVCCGMPKLELGNLEAVEKLKNHNIPLLARLVDDGWDIITPVPSCTLQFKQELPLMFPGDADVAKVQQAFFDPFEYLALRHRAGLLKTEFQAGIGKIAYHVACHQRVQRIGMKTRDVLELIPDTEIEAIERCSGHDGTYAIKKEFHDVSMKIARPVVNRVKKAEADAYASDCPMAGHHISAGLADGSSTQHPISLLRKAYGI
ncbi:MAG: heterodisulfide reductase-related iron-sulfur binding cluster [Gammaproteobacteria bacterium]|nr:heterodisulfide reductase-related iron-sulfur binding cluster [Gammaproteobacteria bacterium]